MRFPQLPLGARFLYQGKVYSKTSALLASAEDGSGQRIIPKYADLAPAEGEVATPAPAEPPAMLDKSMVTATFAAHHAGCRDLLRQVSQDPARIESALADLEAARQRFLAALDAAD
jgi:hypothetical protein